MDSSSAADGGDASESPDTPTEMPKAGWFSILKRSVQQFKHDDVTDRAAALTYFGVLLFAYRTFNSFLLGYLLLETSAMSLRDPKPGDGSFATGPIPAGSDAADSSEPMPGGLSPTRTPAQREAIDKADSPQEFLDPVGDVDPRRSATAPTGHRARGGPLARRVRNRASRDAGSDREIRCRPRVGLA